MAIGCYNPDEHYLPASFKGVPFKALSYDSEHGRRGAEGEFPFGESTAYADMGIRIKTYSMRVRFADNAHVAQTAALISVCESSGPGTLVHPTRGILFVGCRACRVSEDQEKEAGVTYVDLDFVDATSLRNGIGLVTPSGLGLVASTFAIAVMVAFRRDYKPDSVRWYDSTATISRTSRAVNELASAYAAVTRNQESIERNKVMRDFRSIGVDEFALGNPDTASNVLQNGFNYIDTAGEPVDKIPTFRQIATNNSSPSSLEGEAALAEDAVARSMRLLSSVHLARSYLATRSANVDEGLNQMAIVMDMLDRDADTAYDDCRDSALFLAIRAFQDGVSGAMIHRAFNSPTLVTYQFGAPMHALVAAWEIYGDAKRSSDILFRNPGLPWLVGPSIVAERQ